MDGIAMVELLLGLPGMRVLGVAELDDVEVTPDPVFRLGIPPAVPGVPPEVLNPRATWADPAAYDVKARELAGRFAENFAQHVDLASDEVRSVGPDPHA